MQLSLLNLDHGPLRLNAKPERFENIVSEAVRQNTRDQRSMPIPGFTTPDPAECDQWQERLSLKPTGFGVMTPDGVQKFMKLDPQKRGEKRQD